MFGIYAAVELAVLEGKQIVRRLGNRTTWGTLTMWPAVVTQFPNKARRAYAN